MQDAQDTKTTMITSFDSDGFSIGSDNAVQWCFFNETYVAWNWKAGGAPTATKPAGAWYM